MVDVGLAAVLVPAAVALTGTVVTVALTRQSDRRLRQDHEDEQRRLRLDAAMRAGALFAPSAEGPAHPASVAAGLLALTRLDHADLAVALLVDLWSCDDGSVSTETAVLVIDAALRSERPQAQLVAAELLCRNARHLNSCQSLHWPSVVDGCWRPGFGPKTKLLLFDALTRMTLAGPGNEHALRSVAVRLYGIWRADPDERVKGCVGTVIGALLPALTGLGYADFMQGGTRVMLADLRTAARTATANPDGFLDRLVADRSRQLTAWAARCRPADVDDGLASSTTQPVPA
ncbi:MAG TPA: hypothetical protein VFT95_00750 [Micromonosporaceae bacterium]|nr:hypothetical protein [Micromonosporaceae bacterium]